MGEARSAYGLFDLLERNALGPNRTVPAIDYSGEERSFIELHSRALRFASALAAQGVDRGDRIAVMLANGHEWPEVFFGIAARGAVCVPINVLLKATEVDHVIEDSDVRALVVDRIGNRAMTDLSELPATVFAVGDVDLPGGAQAIDYEQALASAEEALPGPRPAGSEVLIHYYTSGTTGPPKATVHSHSGVLWNSMHQVVDLGLSREDVYLCVPSLSWAAGFHDVVLALMWLGGKTVIMPTGGTAIEQIVSTAVETGATKALLVPTLLKQLVSSDELLESLRTSRLRWIISGAEPVPQAVIEAISEALPDSHVVQGYGLSEFPTIATVLRPEEAISHIGMAGRPTSVTTLAVQLDDGSIAPEGAGEILLRSPATMLGYHDREEETQEALADGWLHTGDVGTVDAGGYLRVTGRKKDMIISGGLNVYPREIEEVLYRLDGVREAAVVGVPDEQWGEVAAAIIVSGDSPPSSEVVSSACKDQLANFKCPRHVLFRTDELPRTPSGKVLKRELGPWAAAQLSV